jgi:hypothetical protein
MAGSNQPDTKSGLRGQVIQSHLPLIHSRPGIRHRSTEYATDEEVVTWIVLPLQVRGDFGKLGEGRLEVFDDFGGYNVGVGEIGAVFKVFVFKPENVEVEFVAWSKHCILRCNTIPPLPCHRCTHFRSSWSSNPTG